MSNLDAGNLESGSGKRVSYLEAKDVLSGVFDLGAAKNNAVRDHQRWGLTYNPDAHSRLLDRATIGEKDLIAVKEKLARGEKLKVIFDPGEMNPYRLWGKVIQNSGIPFSTNGYGINNLDNVRKLNPEDVYNLDGLDKRPYQEQINTLKTAFETAPYWEKSEPKIIFTSDSPEPAEGKTSALEDFKAEAAGKARYMDLGSDLLRFRAQVDEALKKAANIEDLDKLSGFEYKKLLNDCFANGSIIPFMPDRKNITRYPGHSFDNGCVPNLYFDSSGCQVVLDFSIPNARERGGRATGSRPALG